MMRKVIAVANSIALLGAFSACGSPMPVLASPQKSASTMNAILVAGATNQAKPTVKLPGFKESFPIDDSKQSDLLVKELKKLSDAEQNPQTMEKAAKLEKEGQDFYEKGLSVQALSRWQEQYGICLEMKYTEGQGRALTNMAKIFVDQAQWVKAKQLGENALELLSSGGSQSSLAQCRVVLAQAYFGLDNPIWAVQQLDAALRSLSNGQLNNPEEGARIMYLCGNLCNKFGKPKEAIRYFQEGAQYSYQKGDFAKAVQVRSAIIGTMIELGWFVAALEEANKLLSVAKASPKDSLAYQASAYQSIANAQFAANEYANARKSYEQVYAILPRLDPRAVPELIKANIDEGYGFVLSASGDLDMARQYLLKALPVFKAKSENFGLAQTYNALGVIEVMDGQPGKGLTYLQQAADYHVVLNPKSPRLQAVTLQNQGCAEFRTGSFRDAKNRFDGALAAVKPLNDTFLKGRLYQGLAEVNFKAADITSAENYLNKAIEIASKINDDGCLWRSYCLLGKIRLTRGEVETGKEALTSALSYFRSPQAGEFPSADSIAFPTSREDMAYLLVQLMASQGMTEEALVTAEQIKEENFITEWMRRGGQVKPVDRDVYTELVTQRSRIHAAELISTPDRLVKEWQSWMERFRGLIATNRSLARLIAPLPTKISDIVEVSKKYNAVAVEYLIGPDSSMAFTVEPSGRVSSSQLNVDRARLKSQVSALLVSAGGANAANSSEADRVTLKALYSELLPKAVRQFMPNTAEQMIVIVPDGPLYNLPFAALIDEQGKFFVENHLLTMTSSMSVLMDSQPRIAQDLSMLFANSNSTGGGEQSEASQITNVVGSDRVTTLYGKDAAIDHVEEQAKGKAVVHFPARLQLIESNPLRSVLPILGDSSGEAAAKKVTAGTFCGTSMPSDLIVWSASSVSSKDVRGNGVKIFSRGLNYAGARNVLMSLWAQPDTDRMDELVNFYKSKQAGLGPAQSLRKAQLSALSRDRSPRNWAAFQLLGPGN